MLGRGLESLIPNNKSGNHQPGVPPLHSNNSVPPFVQRTHHAGYVPPLPKVNYPPHKEKKERSDDLSSSVFQIEVEKIQPNPYQPRKEFNTDELNDLAQSIREFGVLQPLIVAKVIKEKDSGAEVEYQLIAGERRLRAAKLVGLPRVPAIVKQIDAGKMKLEIALIENIQRSNLNPIESARAYAQLQQEFGVTQKEIAIRVGKSREVVANTMRLLNLPSEIQDALQTGRLTESHGRTLLGISNPAEQRRTFLALLEKKTTIREMNEKMGKKQIAQPKNPEHSFWEKRLEEKISAPTTIRSQGKGGEIAIKFYSREELEGILERLTGGE
ncbi:MAG: chromosome partitioning protein, ParB family [Parcubacteria group bacterium LiPW_41]|nr:MAG: chromosome partitioning protein, ParB family [Parcubacteria group bacterium LiPW_41]